MHEPKRHVPLVVRAMLYRKYRPAACHGRNVTPRDVHLGTFTLTTRVCRVTSVGESNGSCGACSSVTRRETIDNALRKRFGNRFIGTGTFEIVTSAACTRRWGKRRKCRDFLLSIRQRLTARVQGSTSALIAVSQVGDCQPIVADGFDRAQYMTSDCTDKIAIVGWATQHVALERTNAKSIQPPQVYFSKMLSLQAARAYSESRTGCKRVEAKARAHTPSALTSSTAFPATSPRGWCSSRSALPRKDRSPLRSSS